MVSVRKGGLSQWLCSLGLVGGGVVRGSGPPLALPPLPHQVINHNPQAAGGACFVFLSAPRWWWADVLSLRVGCTARERFAG